MGYKEIEIHKEATNLYGYQGDKRPEKAHIIIRRRFVGSASNDVGFIRENNRYRVVASGYDSAWRTGNKINKLKQTYGEKVIMKTVSKNAKYRFVSRKENEKGEIKIKVKRY